MNLLSGQDLVKQHTSVYNTNTLSRGLKKRKPENTLEESEAIEELQNALFELLDPVRVERSVVRSVAKYEGGKIVVTRKKKIWNNIGFLKNNIQYLHEHEALYLIEMNRLELYWNSVIVSLEQAYRLLLNKNMSAEAYFVYVELMKMGYIVEQFNIKNDKREPLVFNYKKELNSNEICVWKCLRDRLNHRTAEVNEDDFNNIDNEIYIKIGHSMDLFADDIKMQRNKNNMTTDIPHWKTRIVTKRKIDKNTSRIEPKRFKSSAGSSSVPEEYKADKFLDILLHQESQDKNFQEIFEEIQIIKLTDLDTVGTSSIRKNDKLEFTFDLYLPDTNYKRTKPGVPNYRIVIINVEIEKCPTRRAICELYFRQSFRSPIIVILVNQMKTFQAFIYGFSV